MDKYFKKIPRNYAKKIMVKKTKIDEIGKFYMQKIYSKYFNCNKNCNKLHLVIFVDFWASGFFLYAEVPQLTE